MLVVADTEMAVLQSKPRIMDYFDITTINYDSVI